LNRWLKIILIGVGILVICDYVLEFYLGIARGLAGYLGFIGLFAYIIYLIVRWIRGGVSSSDIIGIGTDGSGGGGGHGGGDSGGGS
jgi:hypothetical protein